jgi:hypothetical protein
MKYSVGFLWEPGNPNKQPLLRVASPRATHKPTQDNFGSEIIYVLSVCISTLVPNFLFLKINLEKNNFELLTLIKLKLDPQHLSPRVH